MIQKKHIKIVLLLSIGTLILTSFLFQVDNIFLNDLNNHQQINNDEKEEKLLSTSSIEWVDFPSLSSKYFSPEPITPGNGDSVIFSFSINESKDFELDISSYYDTIENFPGNYFGGSSELCSYLMENGTWLVVGSTAEVNYTTMTFYTKLILGIGSNASNFVWKDVGYINTTEHIAVAGNESGHIRIVYAETQGFNEEFSGIKYFSSDDWGNNWINGTIANYTDDFTGDFPNYCGISISEFNGNFTSTWSLGDNMMCYLQESQETYSQGWSDAENLTATEGFDARFPQVFYNRTNDNGTLYIGCKVGGYSGTLVVFQLKNGINNNYTSYWFTSLGDAYCTKDYNTDMFYFLDYDETDKSNQGIRNASWGSMTFSDLDFFLSERDYGFDLFANNGPKCFSGGAISETGYYKPGLLDCITPLNVISINSSVNANEKFAYSFDGKDENGVSHDAQAYSFYLDIGEGEKTFDKLAYVDTLISEVEYDKSYSKISPFSSLGFNDYFRLNITSNKDGDMIFNVKSEDSVIGEESISDNENRVTNPAICGDGVNYYLFYSEWTGGDVSSPDFIDLMFSKSTDGGLSWEEPKILDSFEGSDTVKKAECTDTEVFLWTKDTLYISYDFGDYFYEYDLEFEKESLILSVASDLSCFIGEENGTNEYLINKSLDYGMSWDSFASFELTGAANYTLLQAEYDPISGNYSFLLDNIDHRELLFVSMNNDGTEVTVSGDISKFGMAMYGSSDTGQNYGSIDLELRLINASSSEWLIFSSLTDIMGKVASGDWNYRTELAYRTTTNGIGFTDWKNFTALTGENLEVYCHPNTWDITYPNDGEPCFVTGLHPDPNFYFMDIIPTFLRVHSKSSFVFGNMKGLDTNYQGEMNYYGVSSNGERLPDGNYTWDLIVIDRAGYKTEFSGEITIDNGDPVLLGSDDNLTTPENPYPRDKVNVTVPVYEINTDTGLLYYKTTGDWNIIEMDINMDNWPNINFTGTIPNVTEASVDWKVIINDTCGNFLELDNDGRLYSYGRGVYEYVKTSEMINPTLYDDWNWTFVFTSGYDHIDLVWVEKTFGNGTVINCTITATGDNNNNYNIHIPTELQNENATYTFNYRTDEDLEYKIDTKILEKPDIRIEEELEPPEEIDLVEESMLEMSFSIPEGAQYIDYVYIEYWFSSRDACERLNLTTSGSLYKFNLSSFSKDVTEVNYIVKAVDTFGNEYDLNDGETTSVGIIPLMPTWEMTTEQQLLVPIIAAIIGVVTGISYTFMTSQKSEMIKQKNLIQIESEKQGSSKKKSSQKSRKEEKDLKALILNSLQEKRIITIGIATILLAICVVASIILLALQAPEGAMLAFAGAFLASTFLWVILSNHIVERLYRAGESETLKKENILLIGISLVIFITLLAIFLIGDTVAWWRVRVNQRSYDFGSVVIPRALFTVFSTFLSSILLLSWSTLREVKKNIQDFNRAENFNDNPQFIIERREKAISKTIGNVGKKGIIFIAAIGIAIVFASDLSTYATQGVLIIVPFAIGAIIALFIGSYLQKEAIEEADLFIFDNFIICPKCGKETSLSGNYCQHCGKQLIIGKKFEEGIECGECGTINSQASKHCRYCGRLLSKTAKKAKK
ncbi:MAG: zinc ribbon domain-containing protein [Promethearchaeota archaeon]|nr:MAG: zinc ribbon domain-containing protein [Candidatus Lokiarchaeota archaeon]